jgi:BTB/POZ domain
MPVIAMNGGNYPVKTPTSGSPRGIEVQEESIIRNHPVYWFEDGSLVLDVEVQRFKVHRTLLSRHSRFFASLSSASHEISGSCLTTDGSPTVVKAQEFDHIVLEQRKEVRAEDVEALLQHLYHDV